MRCADGRVTSSTPCTSSKTAANIDFNSWLEYLISTENVKLIRRERWQRYAAFWWLSAISICVSAKQSTIWCHGYRQNAKRDTAVNDNKQSVADWKFIISTNSVIACTTAWRGESERVKRTSHANDEWIVNGNKSISILFVIVISIMSTFSMPIGRRWGGLLLCTLRCAMFYDEGANYRDASWALRGQSKCIVKAESK